MTLDTSDLEKNQVANEEKTNTKEVFTAGKQLNKFYQYTIYIIVFSILTVFLFLSFFGFQTNVQIVDVWPFLFVIVILIIYCLTVIEKAKGHTKRTIQRDMREL